MRRLIIYAFLLVIMAVTNPSKADYVSWVKEKAAIKVNSPLKLGLNTFVVQPIIESSTTSNNYIFFSIYKTTFGTNNNEQVLGIFNNFIEIPKSSKYAY